jgi:N-acetylglutamate synthase-like GNAT family acetyltransferase
LVDALVEDCRALGIPEVYSVLRTEDVRDTAFLTSCGFGESRVRLLSRDV